MDAMIGTERQMARIGAPRRNSKLIQGYLASTSYRGPVARVPRPRMAFAGATAAAAAVAVIGWIGAAVPALAAFGG